MTFKFEWYLKTGGLGPHQSSLEKSEKGRVGVYVCVCVLGEGGYWRSFRLCKKWHYVGVDIILDITYGILLLSGSYRPPTKYLQIYFLLIDDYFWGVFLRRSCEKCMQFEFVNVQEDIANDNSSRRSATMTRKQAKAEIRVR